MLDTVVSTYWSLIRTPLLKVFLLRDDGIPSECSRIAIHGWTSESGSFWPQIHADPWVVVVISGVTVVILGKSYFAATVGLIVVLPGLDFFFWGATVVVDFTLLLF